MMCIANGHMRVCWLERRRPRVPSCYNELALWLPHPEGVSNQVVGRPGLECQPWFRPCPHLSGVRGRMVVAGRSGLSELSWMGVHALSRLAFQS